ncbi:hypothetical protein OCA8868_00842 [Octadecabacter ascidiaceicola]|uniref:Uncharacterized protein n=1 Tax=Octadecabacter ascidiaceicola TaxID=1655543 RepID=A0A238JQH1_9RHOB|nr:hypothetical protein OCA8868_00842 [Octadecabacter ascidiaceicola]
MVLVCTLLLASQGRGIGCFAQFCGEKELILVSDHFGRSHFQTLGRRRFSIGAKYSLDWIRALRCQKKTSVS